MIYEIAHFVKDKMGFLWDAVNWCNAFAFACVKRRQLAKLPEVLKECSGEYIYRLAEGRDVDSLVQFFNEQPEEAFVYFRPHEFDAKSIKKIIKNKAFLALVVEKENKIVGYFFLRCFVNGKCFRGKMVHKDWQGKDIAKQMGVAMTKVAETLGMRVFGSISPENYASLASAKASNEIKIIKTLENGYYYIEFLPKK